MTMSETCKFSLVVYESECLLDSSASRVSKAARLCC